MLIEVLYFSDCPNSTKAQETVSSALTELQISANVSLIEVQTDVEALANRFLGSPSIRIDGSDIEFPDETGLQYSMRCRLYRNEDGTSGHPPKQMILSAITKAMKNA